MSQIINSAENVLMLWRAPFKSVMSFVVTLLIVWALFKTNHVFLVIFRALSELFLFWNIALSGSSRSLKKPLRLHPYFCETKYLDQVGVNELVNFLSEDIHMGHTLSAKDVYKVLMQYTHVMLCRDRVDGTLRGIMLVGIDHKGDYTLMRIGFTIFKNYYRGSPYLNITLSCLLIAELLKHPLTPVYMVGKLYSYKAYLIVTPMREMYPVYDRETPEHYKKVFADFAEKIVRFKGGRAKYNPETFVIEQEDNHLAENLTTLSEQDLLNPHIKFFIERNPGWRKGHCLVVGLRCTWGDFVATVKRTLVKILKQQKHSKSMSTKDEPSIPHGSKGHKKQVARSKLLRRCTFQELSANSYAINNLEYDMAGEVMLSPQSKARYAFRSDLKLEADASQTELNIDLDSWSLI